LLTNVIGVKFKKEGRIYNFNAGDLLLHRHDQVIVNTENGPALGVIVTDVKRCEAQELPPNLKKVIRMLTAEDLRIKDENKQLEEESKKYCQGKIKDKQLPMKLITVDYLFDRSKIIFYFTAETRVDFRDLVKDLVQKFKTRIELKQIGARQESGIIKGVAVCGRTICCAGILQNLERVTVKMAKEQSMSLNPEKISGLCGRLMCCLAFEHEGYAGSKKCSKAAKSAGNCIPCNSLPDDKKITAPGKMDEKSDSDSPPRLAKQK
jgi:cell fate regulator YaaT (PSP1 superfamily)